MAQSKTFGRLLKMAVNGIAAYESKNAPIVEDELGRQIGLSAAAIQRYKAGHIPPEPRTVQMLAEAAVQRGRLDGTWLAEFLQAAQYPAPCSNNSFRRPCRWWPPRPQRQRRLIVTAAGCWKRSMLSGSRGC